MKLKRVRKVILLILPLLFSLTACGSSNPSSSLTSDWSSASSLPEEISDSTITIVNSDAQSYLDRFNAAMASAVAESSQDGATSVSAFKSAEEAMKELRTYKEKAEVGEIASIAEDVRGETGKYLNEEYWHLQYKLLYAFKYQLSISPAKAAYIAYLGQEKYDRWLSRDPNLVFTKREVQAPSAASLEAILEETKSLSADAANGPKVREKIVLFQEGYDEVRRANSLSNVRYDIDNTDEASRNQWTECSATINACKSALAETFRTIYDSPCKDYFLQTYGATFFDSYLKQDSGYSKAMLALLSQETELQTQYSQDADEDAKKQTLLDLIALRKKIVAQANSDYKTSYANYEDYLYKVQYQRDYTAEDATKYTESLKALYGVCYKAYTAYVTPDANGVSESGELAKISFPESACLASTEFVRKLSPDMGRVLDKMEDYGLYNFDVSNDKSNGGYTLELGDNADLFIFDCPEQNYYDLAATWHEFGHYYYGTKVLEEYGTLGRENTDLAEINSIGLELLGLNFLGDFAWSDLQKKAFLDAVIYKKLSTILVVGVVNGFEHYCYTTTDDLTATLLDNEWDSLKNQYGIKKLWNYSTLIHLYASPCYYVSYSTSSIPSLEIFMKSKQEGLEQGYFLYDKLIEETDRGGFKTTLGKIGLSDPFSSNIISSINDFLTSTFYS